MEPLTPEKRSEIAHILLKQGVPEEEIDLFIERAYAGWSIETSEVQCWVCDGRGSVPAPGVTAGSTCGKCFGSGRAFRFIMVENKVSE